MSQLLKVLDRFLRGPRPGRSAGRVVPRSGKMPRVRSCRLEYLEDRRLLALDYGDAPDDVAGLPDYPTLAASGGAFHDTSGPFLGENDPADADDDGQPDANAEGDDNDGNDDENGVTFSSTTLEPLGTYSVSWYRGGGGGWVRGWIDFNGDGDWDDSGERIADPSPAGDGPGSTTFTVPGDAPAGPVFARFRISNSVSQMSPTGNGGAGEVEDYRLEIQPVQTGVDWGDAPSPYATLDADNGASHTIDAINGPWLGPVSDAPDPESDGQPSTGAVGDNENGDDDENGVTGLSTLTIGEANEVTYEIGAGFGKVRGWIDFDGDGLWETDEGELVVNNEAGQDAGSYLVSITPPEGAVLGTTYARFRIVEFGDQIDPTGPLEDGEVEDYQVTLVEVEEIDWGDADFPYPTLDLDGGASHIIGGPWLGGAGDEPDAEDDGQADFFALGDDNDLQGDDEGGVEIAGWTVSAGEQFTVDFTIGGEAAYIRGWIDYTGDGDWDDAGEEFLSPTSMLPAGQYSMSFTVPSDAVEGETFARFRVTSEQTTIGFGGQLPDGEVEDYKLEILGAAADPLDYGDAPYEPSLGYNYPTMLAQDGARHEAIGVYLGVTASNDTDVEEDGQPGTTDDFDDYDDEEGVVFLTETITAGEDFTIEYDIRGGSGAARIKGWLDFNGDGDWDDSGELFLNPATPLADGHYSHTSTVPAGAEPGATFARFRVTTDGAAIETTGYLPNGEVEDYGIAIESLATDYGDAPYGLSGQPDYPTLLAQDGARHLSGGPWLGGVDDEPDADDDGQPDINAEGDDLDGNDDEGGVRMWGPGGEGTPLLAGEQATVQYEISNSGGNAYFRGWLDLNRDGDWQDPGELIVDRSGGISDGVHTATFDVPIDAPLDRVFGRFRVTTATDTFDFAGELADGEVEDHSTMIEQAPATTDYGDAPPGYPTLSEDFGAVHTIGGPFLGDEFDAPDAEPNGIPSLGAVGDDNNNENDEQGVQIYGEGGPGSPLVPGQQGTIQYEVRGSGAAANLRGWIDFNGNDSWNDSGELVLDLSAVPDGPDTFTFTVPSGIPSGETYARFRISTQVGMQPTGAAADGEVEDHQVTVETPASTVVGRYVFYNNSYFDGNDSLPGAGDDGAIAPDPSQASHPDLGKVPLLPGEQATFQNVISYDKGINGIMVDIEGLRAAPTPSDFIFTMGNDASVETWGLAADPSSITTRFGEGLAGSDRVTITWNDYTPPSPDPATQAVAKQWLGVTVLDTDNTGLSQADTFYWGNALGDSGTGNTTERALVSAIDFGAVRDNPHSPNNRALIDDFVDYNRDSLVNAIDFGIVRDNPASPNTALVFLDLTATPAPEAPNEATPSLDDGGWLAPESTQNDRLAAGPQVSDTALVDTVFGQSATAPRAVFAEEYSTETSLDSGTLGHLLASLDEAPKDAQVETDGPLDEDLLDLIATDQVDR